MSTFLQISFSGLATGAIFALAAVGFALLWQTAGAINFAHGEFIVLPAVIILILGEQQPTLGVPDWVPLVGGTELAGPLPEIGIIAAFAVTIPIAILLLGYVFKASLVDRLLTPGGDDIPLVIATIGLGLVIREYLRLEFGATPQQFPSIFGTEVWRPGGIAISADDVGILAVSIVVILALQMFLRRTYTGWQMEAAAQNPNTARVLGIPVGRMILYTFAINAVLVTVAALLVSPTTNARFDGGISPRPVRLHRRHHRWLQPGARRAVRRLPRRAAAELVGLLHLQRLPRCDPAGVDDPRDPVAATGPLRHRRGAHDMKTVVPTGTGLQRRPGDRHRGRAGSDVVGHRRRLPRDDRARRRPPARAIRVHRDHVALAARPRGCARPQPVGARRLVDRRCSSSG